jgi:hypothetical protein
MTPASATRARVPWPPRLGGLAYLELECNRIGEEGALTLVRSQTLHRLVGWFLHHNGLSSETPGRIRSRFGASSSGPGGV